MKFKLLTTALSLFTLIAVAQFPDNHFQSEENIHYWKNKKPYEGYWQQDVHYTIYAKLNDSTNIISGKLKLEYTNNSPDNLPFVFFNLYNNAQAKGSYLSDLYKNNGRRPWYGKYQKDSLGTNISSISLNGKLLQTEQDNTVQKVYLPEPIKSGESVSFEIEFTTYFDYGAIRNRMKMFNSWGYKHYDVVHWYPRIAVYDRKFGWNTDQHLDREFYGDFGTYDVAFTLPSHYIVDATGTLINEDKVLPLDLKEKLRISNFKDKPWGEQPSVIIEPDGSTKTWLFHAENVHDFALTADPTYRIGTAEWNGIKCISLVQEPHASRWQNAASYAAKVIEVNSKEFGKYEYPKIIVADARDGMEYPMLTLDRGADPHYRNLLVHEISHNWFFGMLGSNETYRAAMDEGFTQFAESWTYSKIDGEYIVKNKPTSNYVAKHRNKQAVIDRRVYLGYMYAAARGIETNINTHSDGYSGALRHGGGYGQVYYKTAVMLYNLQYVLGDSLFWNAMRNYVEQWKFAHPYIEDFRNSIIQYTHVDLNWFFDQWIETSKTIDYKIKSIEEGFEPNEYQITFERKGMQMPLDFRVVAKNDSIYDFHIPNNWFEKETNATVLDRWIGWDKIKPTYRVKLNIPSGVANVIIDPSNRLADVYMLDNSKLIPTRYHFDSKIYNSPSWKAYEVFSRPEIWYNGYDGVKVGFHAHGNYLKYKHQFDANLWMNTGVLQNHQNDSASKLDHEDVSFRFNYRTSTDEFMKGSYLYTSAKALDGLNEYIFGFDRIDRSTNNKVYLYFKSIYRDNNNDLAYLLIPSEWQAGKFNNTINFGLEHKYKYYQGNGLINIKFKSSAIKSAYDYNAINVEAINSVNIGKFMLRTRVVGQYGSGSNWANESSLFLSGANPEEMMDNKYTRSQGFIDPSWASIGESPNYFHMGGGLNIRGYSGYLSPQIHNNGDIYSTYKGESGVAVNAELEFSKLFKFNKSNWLTKSFNITTYIFGDAGIINYTATTNNRSYISDLRADAGLGGTFTIKKFGVLETVKPLTIRLDIPLFLNRLPASEENYVQSRFIIGINRAF